MLNSARADLTCAIRMLVSVLVVLSSGSAQVSRADLIPEIRYKLSAGDLWSADAIADEFCRVHAETEECADALAWLARGAVMLKQNEQALAYAERAESVSKKLSVKGPVEDGSYLAAAIGGAIEVSSEVLTAEGHRDEALALLNSQLGRYSIWSIQARIQKNINLLSLVGKQAPLLPEEAIGHPTLMFLWGHWCSDCTGEAPVIDRIRRSFGSKGLVLLAPTRRNGTVGENQHATAEQENAEIESVWNTAYPGLQSVPHPVDEPIMQRYGVSSTPTIVLIDRSGVVRLYCPFRLSESALAAQIQRILPDLKQ